MMPLALQYIGLAVALSIAAVLFQIGWKILRGGKDA
jgi:hypothetical protein